MKTIGAKTLVPDELAEEYNDILRRYLRRGYRIRKSKFDRMILYRPAFEDAQFHVALAFLSLGLYLIAIGIYLIYHAAKFPRLTIMVRRNKVVVKRN